MHLVGFVIRRSPNVFCEELKLRSSVSSYILQYQVTSLRVNVNTIAHFYVFVNAVRTSLKLIFSIRYPTELYATCD